MSRSEDVFDHPMKFINEVDSAWIRLLKEMREKSTLKYFNKEESFERKRIWRQISREKNTISDAERMSCDPRISFEDVLRWKETGELPRVPASLKNYIQITKDSDPLIETESSITEKEKDLL